MSFSALRVAKILTQIGRRRKGGHSLEKGTFLPSMHVASTFYEPPSVLRALPRTFVLAGLEVSNRRSRFAAIRIAIGSQRFKIALVES